MYWRLAVLVLFCWVSAARADMVFVLNSGDATISVLDAATRQLIRRIQVLREPHHMVLTPDGRQLLVADSGGNEVFFLDPMTGEVQRRERISNPYQIEFSPDGRYLVVASLRRDQVDVLDGTTLALIHRFRPGDMPSHVAFSPDSRFAYVTLQGDRAVVAFDLARLTQLWTQEVGPEPAGIIWHRGKLLVGIMGSDHFVSLDPETREVTRLFTLGRGAHTVFPAPDGRALFATSRVDSRIAEIDPETLAIRRQWDIPGGPDCLSFDPDGRIWLTLRWIGRVAVFDPAAGTWDTIRVGRSPHGIHFQARRPDVPGDFASSMPGAMSGSRPLAMPLPRRPAEGAPVPVALVPGAIPAAPAQRAVARRAP